MAFEVGRIEDRSEASRLCAAVIAQLPMWFGRPQSNEAYVRGAAERDCFAVSSNGETRGLIALEYHFDTTCNVWWLGVLPDVHRRGMGRRLVERAASEARERKCRFLAVLTMGPRDESPEYALTRRFYQAVGFLPFIELEPEPGDHMMWMIRPL